MASRSAFSLSAVSDTLVVDIEAGETFATTLLDYAKDPDWVVMHRLDDDDWLPVPIAMTGPTDPALVRGSFTSLAVGPGHRYQACIVPPDLHPDASQQPYDVIVPYDEGEGPVSFASVVALRKVPEERDFYSDGNVRAYGTYLDRDVIATQPVHAQATIGTIKPVDLGDGRLMLPSPVAVQVRGPGLTFAFRLTGLVPGTEYHVLVLLVDAFGNWQFVSDQATTLRRKVVVKLDKLFVIDDSDDWSTGEAGFQFYVSSGGPGVHKSNVVTYGNSNLDSGHYTVPPPTGTCTLGPYAPLTAWPRVFFHTTSIEDNSGSFPAEGDDLAYGMSEIECPTGPGETQTNRSGSVIARDPVSENYEYRVDYLYSISYL